MKYTVENNINNYVIDEQEQYQIVLTTIDYDSGSLEFLVHNKTGKDIYFCRDEVSIDSNVVLAKMHHDSTKVVEDIVCAPKIETSIGVIIEELSARENVALFFSFSVKAGAREYDKYNLCLSVDFDFDSIDIEVEKTLGADLESLNIPDVEFVCSEESNVLDQQIEQLVNYSNDRDIVMRALERRNGGEDYNLEKMGLFYKNNRDYNNYLYNMKQLVAHNNSFGLTELACLFLDPTKEEKDKLEGYECACKLEMMNDPIGTFWKGYAQINGIGVKRSVTEGVILLQKFIDHPKNNEKVNQAKFLVSSVYVDYYPEDIKKLSDALKYRNELNLESEDIKSLIDIALKKNNERKIKIIFICIFIFLLLTFGRYFNKKMPVINLHSYNKEAQSGGKGNLSNEFEVVSSYKTSNMQNVQVNKVSASSELIGASGKVYSSDFIIDGDIQTSWQEGEEGDGSGCTILFDFDETVSIDAIELYLGKQKSEKDYYKNNRPKKLEINFDNEKYEVELKDTFGPQTIVFKETLKTKKVMMTILEVYKGNSYDDTNIGEVFFLEK